MSSTMKRVRENHLMPLLLNRIFPSLLALALVCTSLIAQPPGKPNRVKEEEESTPPAAQTTPSSPVKPQKEPAQLQSITWGPFNLAEEAKAAVHPEVKKYLQDLSLTAEEVTSTTGKVYRTAPIAKMYDPKQGKTL